LKGGATIGLEAKDVAEFMEVTLPIDNATVSGRVVVFGRIVNIPDIEADANYDLATIQRISSVRSMLGVPLLRQGKAEGTFFLGKPEPNAFKSI
jgi:GAF domain-containing protein